MLNESTERTANGLHRSTSQTNSNKFDLTSPTRILQIEYNEATFKKLLNQQIIKFEFSTPIKIPINFELTKPVQSRTHLILVDQAPFSVFKSVKSQKRTVEEKTDNKLVVINSNRSHPYNNSIRPSDLRSGQPSFQTALSGAPEPLKPVQLEEKPIETDISEAKSSESILTSESSVPQAGTKINRNSSSNAILAQIKSLGPTFRSIFVRPKNTKPIDSKVLKSTGVLINKKTSLKSTGFDYKKLLQQSLAANSADNNFDENFISRLPTPKELKVNSSVDDVFKKLTSQENDLLGKTTPLKRTSRKEADKSRSSHSEKWTCMVCLSKHLETVDICSICGSSRPESKPKLISQNITFSRPVHKTSPKRSLFDRGASELQSKKTDDILSLLQDDNYFYPRSFLTPKPNPYIKKWTCQHCNYSNDSLKIVCLNCRWVKTAPIKTKQALELNDTLNSPSKSHQTDPIESDTPTKKIKPSETFTNFDVNPKQVNEEPQVQQQSLASLFAKSKSNKWSCENCLSENDNQVNSCASCGVKKPGSKVEEKPKEAPKESLASLFFKSKSNKWSCENCLSENDNQVNSCASCGVKKPGSKVEEKPKEAPKESLASLFSKSNQNKWTCSECLLNNDESNSKCNSCNTARPGTQSKETTKETTMSKTDVPASTNRFSFGLASNDSSTSKLSFTSNFGMNKETSSAGFAFKPFVDTESSNKAKETDKQNNKQLDSSKCLSFEQNKPEPNVSVDQNKPKGFGFSPLIKSGELLSTNDTSVVSKDSFFAVDKSNNLQTNQESLKSDIFAKDKTPSSVSLFGFKDNKSTTDSFNTNKTDDSKKKTNSSILFNSFDPANKSDSNNRQEKISFSAFQPTSSNVTDKKEDDSKKSGFFGMPNTSSALSKPELTLNFDSSSTKLAIASNTDSSISAPAQTDLSKFSQNFFSPISNNQAIFPTQTNKTVPNSFSTPTIGGIASPITNSNKPSSGFLNTDTKDNKETNIFPAFGSSTTSGLFGSTDKEQNASGLFGSTNKEQNASGLFGSTKIEQNTSGLFGSTNKEQNASGLFGSTNKEQNASGLFGSVNNETNKSSLFATQSLENNTKSSNQGGNLFVQSGGLSTGLFGSMSKPNETSQSGTSNVMPKFGTSAKSEQGNGFAIGSNSNLFGSNSSPFGAKKAEGVFGIAKPEEKTGLLSPFNSNPNLAPTANPFNFTSTPTSSTTPNMNPFGSALSTSISMYPTPEISNLKNPVFDSEPSTKRAWQSDTSPNISFQNNQTPSSSEINGFNSTIANTPINAQSNNQQSGFSFGQGNDMKFDFGFKTNSNGVVQFSGSNEQSKSTSSRRFLKGRRHFR